MSKHAPRSLALVLTSSAVLITGCSVGPDYVQPSTPEAAAYKESGP